MPFPTDFTGLLEWRCIGPFRGGRVVAVAGDPRDIGTFYFGACAGGVWKTVDGGMYWECVSDGFFNTAAIGAIAVSESDPNVIYAGTGETTIRIDVSHGDGVYKSTDAGKTWIHAGLADTRFIGKIRIHPHNPDVVWVAALGHAFGPNDERGVFKSIDGGATWRKVLFKSNKAGAVDLTLDPNNPRILYAAVWEAYRSFWQISSGGPDSSLWMSHDSGETWIDITDRPGLPKGLKGKMAVAASPAQSGRVWALIEHAKEGGLYRSDNYGDTWEKVSDNQNLISRAWYYMHLTPDPLDPETIWVNNLSLWKSTDGGRTFVEVATPHGDNHDLWIDPRNNRRMIQGNDGGACVSFNGGASWSSIHNQPTAQFYHLAVDDRKPYVVYGTQQDNTSIAVPSRSRYGGILWGDCWIAGTGESGYIAVRPDNPDIVYVGAIGSSPGGGNCLQRYDHSIRQIRLITTWPEYMGGYGAIDHTYRFAWTYPIVISPHDPNTLYIGGNVIFRTTDEGQTWEAISPDLTRADPATLQPTGGPINRDSIGAEVYATVFAFIESPHERGVFWAGSDDGLIHLSRDGGATWQNVTPPTLPEWTLISCIEPSPFDPATVYVAATRYKLDDYQPYLYKTTDYGATWQRIDAGIPTHDFTRVVRADPVRQGLLFAGAETGLYLSFDDGTSWTRFMLNLPVAPIHDIQIKDSDLIAGTHGRSIWILDDITPLRQMHAEIDESPVHLFTPRTTERILPGIDWTGNNPGKEYLTITGGAFVNEKQPDGTMKRRYLDVGQNPPRGVIVTYYLKETPAEPITLSFYDSQGNPVRRFRSKAPESAEAPAEGDRKDDKEPKVPAHAGWNRFVWDMRHAPAPRIEGKDPPAEMVIEGPFVAPGTFRVTLQVGDTDVMQEFVIVQDPQSAATPDDLKAQHDLAMRMHQLIDTTVRTINRMRDLRAQLDGWAKRTATLPDGAPIAAQAKALREKVLEIEKQLLVPDLRPGWADNLNQGVRLLEKLVNLTEVVQLGDYRPTDAAEAVFQDLSSRIADQIARFDVLIESDLPSLNAAIAERGFGSVAL